MISQAFFLFLSEILELIYQKSKANIKTDKAL